MIVTKGYGDGQLIVTQGYGARYTAEFPYRLNVDVWSLTAVINIISVTDSRILKPVSKLLMIHET